LNGIALSGCFESVPVSLFYLNPLSFNHRVFTKCKKM
jgi:hypothetical protein